MLPLKKCITRTPLKELHHAHANALLHMHMHTHAHAHAYTQHSCKCTYAHRQPCAHAYFLMYIYMQLAAAMEGVEVVGAMAAAGVTEVAGVVTATARGGVVTVGAAVEVTGSVGVDTAAAVITNCVLQTEGVPCLVPRGWWRCTACAQELGMTRLESLAISLTFVQ